VLWRGAEAAGVADAMIEAVWLMVYLLSLYIAAMVMFWHGKSGQQPDARLETAGRLALQESQTIVGVVDTVQGMAFALSDYVRDEKY